MKDKLTVKNIAFGISILLGAFLIIVSGIMGKVMGSEEVATMFTGNNIDSWTLIIGIGEIVSALLFVIPQTMRLGTVLLSSYFGGAIMFHMSHPMEEFQSFVGTIVFLVAVWILSWLRGNALVTFDK